MFTALVVGLFANLDGQPPDHLNPVPFTSVKIQDRFWTPRQLTNQSATVIHCLDELEKTGDLENFRIAIRGGHTGRKGFVFQDSDVYKVIEGASFTLATKPNPEVSRRLDEIIDLIGKAQMPDGYVDTYYQVVEPGRRFTNLRDNHELYCAGHLIEAAVAHNMATGKRNLLDIAVKYGNLLVTRFGGDGKGYGGHPELELALVKLSNLTGDHRYFGLASKLVHERGSHYFATEHDTPENRYDGTYWLDDRPLVDQGEIKGHAVRAAYLLSGAADVVRAEEDEPLEHALDKVWKNATEKRVFVTGGIGPSAGNEGFTVDYDLPNESAYQETCASVAMAMWGYRMGLLHGQAKYFDSVETSLYNGVLAGVSLDGTKFFYVNPLASAGAHHRQDWFDCACCPPNALRTIASVGGYGYAQKGSDLFVNLYLPGSAEMKVDGKPIKLEVKGDYPWTGDITVAPVVASPTAMSLHLRIPGWCPNASVKVNGEAVESSLQNGYAVVSRTWKTGDRVQLNLEMPVQRVAANPNVKPDIDRLSVRRGPIVYCAEQVDESTPLPDVVLPPDSAFKQRWNGSLDGFVELTGQGEAIPEPDWQRKLYQAEPEPIRTSLGLIPYCDWDNRKAGPMEVWFPMAPPPPRAGGPEVSAKVEASFVNENAQIEAINDGVEPASSAEAPARLMHWWPHKGSQEWVSYEWTKPISVKGAKVYWFDDTGRGECRLPDAWHLEKWQNGAWVPVEAAPAPIALDKWCEIEFPEFSTNKLRLVVKLKDGWAAGIRQWKIVLGDE